MAKKSEHTYEWAKAYVTDKDKVIDTFIFNMLDRTQAMFRYVGLPDSMNSSQLENILQQKGNALITKVNDTMYALSGGYSGEIDVYGNPTQYTVSNVALNLSKTYTIGENCVLMKNDFHEQGILPILAKYAALMCDAEISLNTVAVLSRIALLISAPDEKTRASAESFIKKIMNGEFTIIGENQFFDGIRLQTPNASNQQRIIDFVELMQYYRATMFNEIGLNSNYNMKREKLSATEAAMNIDVLLPLIDNMLECRQIAIEQINDMFGTSIEVDFASSWKTTHEEQEQATELVMTNSALHEAGELIEKERQESEPETGNEVIEDDEIETSNEESNKDSIEGRIEELEEKIDELIEDESIDDKKDDEE